MRRLAFALGCGVLVGCFDAPSADVMFSCDPEGAPACPEGYTCEADGCCHRDGSDVAAHAGECKLQGGTEGATTMLPGTSTGTDATSTGTGSSDTGTTGTTTDTTSTGTTTTDATTGTTTADSSSDDSSSGDATTDTGDATTGSTT